MDIYDGLKNMFCYGHNPFARFDFFIEFQAFTQNSKTRTQTREIKRFEKNANIALTHSRKDYLKTKILIQTHNSKYLYNYLYFS